jgi:hypothetical protein
MNKKLLIILLAGLVVLSAFLVGAAYLITNSVPRDPDAVAFKPVIYLYNSNEQPYTETLSVSMQTGYAFETIPAVELGPTITWDNFTVYPDSQILYDGVNYPYLFYEVRLKALDLSDFECGWEIQNLDNTWTVNGEFVGDLEEFFTESLLELGLYEHEITEFTEYWLYDQQLFTDEGTYILRQLPLDVVNDLFQLETTQSYSMTRVFFTFSYFSETDMDLELRSPELVSSEVDSEYILHEWGLIF